MATTIIGSEIASTFHIPFFEKNLEFLISSKKIAKLANIKIAKCGRQPAVNAMHILPNTSKGFDILPFPSDDNSQKDSPQKTNAMADNIAREYVQNYSGEDNDSIRVQYKYIMDFEQFYFDSCFKGDCYYFDFADLLHYSVKYLEKLVVDTKLRFDYIIIDEYQDISQIKYELTYKTAKRNDAKVYAVGDDWQSIYAFSGSRIEYIYRFKEFHFKSLPFSQTELIEYLPLLGK